MPTRETFVEHLTRQGVSRRSFLKFCALTASGLALTPGAARVIAATLETTPRPRVIWVSGQECTGCSESLMRTFGSPGGGIRTIENLILSDISLDYHNTLMAPSGAAAERSREVAIADGGHVLVVDGSIPIGTSEAWSIIGGRTMLDVLKESAANAGLIIAIGNCAAFGGIPGANPNPTNAHGVDIDLPEMQGLIQLGELSTSAPIVNLPGCPPVPEVISGTIVYFLTFGALPALDQLKRPTVFYGQTVHDNCGRLPAFANGYFAESFDDEAARDGACLLHLGCKGPVTSNACATLKWNGETSFPMFSGHGCIGCSEPNFWDAKDSFYTRLF